MGVPNSEVGYSSAMPRWEDHEVHKNMWWHWEKKNFYRTKILGLDRKRDSLLPRDSQFIIIVAGDAFLNVLVRRPRCVLSVTARYIHNVSEATQFTQFQRLHILHSVLF